MPSNWLQWDVRGVECASAHKGHRFEDHLGCLHVRSSILADSGPKVEDSDANIMFHTDHGCKAERGLQWLLGRLLDNSPLRVSHQKVQHATRQ